MDYELAKQLDERGFPATPRTGGWVKVDFGAAIAVPTLSELIEACEDSFGGLLKQDGYFIAASSEELPKDVEKGSTPEEAVAKLWLQLNAK